MAGAAGCPPDVGVARSSVMDAAGAIADDLIRSHRGGRIVEGV